MKICNLGPWVVRNPTALPCDENGHYLPPHYQPPPPPDDNRPELYPFEWRIDFDFAYQHFVEVQNSEGSINKAIEWWAAALLQHEDCPPWTSAQELYETIDNVQKGNAPWKTYKIRYQGPVPPGTPPKWMTETYELVTRDALQLAENQLLTTDFEKDITSVPYLQFDKEGRRVWSNLMSGDWAYKQATSIAEDPNTHGAMFVPIVAGSDKTTVSVATGHQEYHPVYMSPGILTNSARRARGTGVLPVAFLPIPKANRKQRKTVAFQKFSRQMYHMSLARVFAPLKPAMTTPKVIRCSDGHFRRAILGLGPYIANYPEQVWLAGIVSGWCPKCDARPTDLDGAGAVRRSHNTTDVFINSFSPSVLWDDYGIRADVIPFTHGFPRADIHELLSPDLLHQVIKGTFKDHIVSWVNEYLHLVHGETRANEIIDDIDRRISAVPPFPGLRRFPDGRDFLQWTSDDSKALMKVYLPAIAGHVPPKMVKCVAAFLDFCYLARRNALNTDTLTELDAALARFHEHRTIFTETGVRTDISLPRQHFLKHYSRSIQLFGSPNGLCSSITESKHIKAVKEPWRRSSRFKALKQMLRTNCRLDKMASARHHFAMRGMMEGTTLSYTAKMLRGEPPEPPNRPTDDEDDDGGPAPGPRVMSSVELARTLLNWSLERGYPKNVEDLATFIGQPKFPELIRRFLFDQLNPNSKIPSSAIAVDDLPYFGGSISVFHPAVARFYAPSDLCGAGGMCQERIRSNPCWRGEYPRRDTVFISLDPDQPGMHGMVVGRVFLFFSFVFQDVPYSCALVHWLVPIVKDDNTGMWVVRPKFSGNGRRSLAVIHLDSVVRATHLIGVYGSGLLPVDFPHEDSLDAFAAFYVSKYADHHMHEFLVA